MQPSGRGYDHGVSTFSPDGRLYQVEYARESVKRGTTTVGLKYKEGVILIVDKRISSKLIIIDSIEKMYKIDDHIACAVAGITSDANILINYCRLASQRYLFQYDEAVPLENLLMTVCDTKQGYTQYGGEHSIWWAARRSSLMSASFRGRPAAVRRELPVCGVGQALWLPAVPE